jgi:hypothetical protein
MSKPANISKDSPRARPAKGTPAGKANSPARNGTKQAVLIGLLQRPGGATIAQMTAKTGWQPHSVRGAISGTLKKKLGLTVESAVTEDRGRVYRIAERG